MMHSILCILFYQTKVHNLLLMRVKLLKLLVELINKLHLKLKMQYQLLLNLQRRRNRKPQKFPNLSFSYYISLSPIEIYFSPLYRFFSFLSMLIHHYFNVCNQIYGYRNFLRYFPSIHKMGGV